MRRLRNAMQADSRQRRGLRSRFVCELTGERSCRHTFVIMLHRYS
jgi:hypothetical protein